MSDSTREVLVHVGAGIGNVILATPLFVALHEMGYTIDVWLTCDYAQTASLLKPWSVIRTVMTDSFLDLRSRDYTHIVPAIPPFYWRRYAAQYSNTLRLVSRPGDSLFYQDEQEFYLSFARRLGYATDRRPLLCLPAAPSDTYEVGSHTLVIAPGCKTGEMAAKRWPHYSELVDEFDNVAVVGTADDLRRYNGQPTQFSPHVKTFVDRLTLRETAELLAAAGAVVANDTGLAYVSAAIGTPTLILFGPTPHTSLGLLPPNVRVLRAGFACEPCWFNARFSACAGRIDCLAATQVPAVIRSLEELGFSGEKRSERSIAMQDHCELLVEG
jgi:ADP-heptose:LPS heptosyltransferase